MVALGYGSYVRARDVVALVPIEAGDRGEGRRTYVHVEGLPAPIVASRSERTILAEMERALSADAGALGERALPASRSRGVRRWRLSDRRLG